MQVMLMHDEARKGSLPHAQCACYMRTSRLVTPRNPPDSDSHQLLHSIHDILYSMVRQIPATGHQLTAQLLSPCLLLKTCKQAV